MENAADRQTESRTVYSNDFKLRFVSWHSNLIPGQEGVCLL